MREGGEKKKTKRFSAIPRDDANAKRTRVPARLQHFCDYFQTQHVVVHDEHPKVWDCGRGPAAHRFFTPKSKNFRLVTCGVHDETFKIIISIPWRSLSSHHDFQNRSLSSKKKRRKKRETQTRKRVVPRKPRMCVYSNVIIYVQNVQEEEDVQNTSSPSLPQTSKDGFDDGGEALSSSSSLSRSSRRRCPPREEAEER